MDEPRLFDTVPGAKVSIPVLPPAAVSRARLLRLVAGDQDTGAAPLPAAAVVLVRAPAGYGKTWFLAEYAAELTRSAVPTGWLSCHRRDSAEVFWSGVVTALRRALFALGRPSAAALEGLVPPGGPTDLAFVAKLLDAIEPPPVVGGGREPAAGSPPGPEADAIVLFLDGVHELVAPEALEALELLLELAPSFLRLVLAARREPPVGLHRLRVAGRLHELTPADLAFTEPEAFDCWLRLGLDLPSEAQRELLARTEGWPVGLRLLAQGASRHAAAPEATPELDDHALATYLAAEVLADLETADRAVLELTSVVPEVTAEFAERLSGRAEAGTVLYTLAGRDALVEDRVTDTGRCYRPHPLLRESLRTGLRRSDPATAARQHATAARWLAEHGRGREALGQALAAGDDQLVAEVLADHGLGLLLRGERAVVERALDGVSATGNDSAPVLSPLLSHRVLTALARDDAAAAEVSHAALAALPPDAGQRATALRGVVELRRAALGLRRPVDDGQARLSRFVSTPLDWAALLSGGEDLRAVALADRGVLRLTAGRYADARSDAQTALALARAADYDELAASCLALCAGASAHLGDYAAARRVADEAIALAADRGWAHRPPPAYAYAVAGWTAHLALESGSAAARAATAREVLTGVVPPEVEATARVVEAVVAADEPTAAGEALDRLRATTETLERHAALSPALLATAATEEVRLTIALGQRHRVAGITDRARRRLDGVAELPLLDALLLLDRGRLVEARRALAPLLADRLPTALPTTPVRAWLLEAHAARLAGQPAATTQALRAALERGQEIGVSRPFYDAGPTVWELLAGIRGRAGTVEGFLDRVLADIVAARGRQQARATASAQASESGEEELTGRERELLRELPSLLTVAEIAAEHSISANTVKTHLRAIYRKLGAESRREAVAAARQRGLL